MSQAGCRSQPSKSAIHADTACQRCHPCSQTPPKRHPNKPHPAHLRSGRRSCLSEGAPPHQPNRCLAQSQRKKGAWMVM